MIRTLTLIAIVSFVLSVVCFAGAFATVGGAFYVDDDWRFHRTSYHHADHLPVVPMKTLRGEV